MRCWRCGIAGRASPKPSARAYSIGLYGSSRAVARRATGSASAWCGPSRIATAPAWRSPTTGPASRSGSTFPRLRRVPNELPVALVVAGGAMIDPPRRLRHHVAKPLRIEPGAAQHRRHHLVGEQIFQARLIAAAVKASGHDPLLTYEILRRITRKHVLFVTPGRIFSGNLYITSAKFSSKWSDRRQRRPRRSGPGGRNRPKIAMFRNVTGGGVA